MLIKVSRSGEIEGDYFQNLQTAEQANLWKYIERKEKEEEEFRQKIREWQQERKSILKTKKEETKEKTKKLKKGYTRYSSEHKK